MNDNIELVKRMNKAAEKRDFDTLKSLLHPQYTLKDPVMEINSPEEFLQFMRDCPFTCKMENVSFISEGNKVVQTLDTVMTDPVAFSFRMCDIVTIKDGKVVSEETFYDTAQFPPEAKEINDRAILKARQKKAA